MEPAGLYGIDQWRITALTLFSILLAAEIGRWVGRRGRRRSPESAGARVEVFEGALLGLLSLMIGFTFSLALNRFEQRKEVVLNEANAIGTVVLRARLLPDAQAAQAGRAARQYAQTRLELGYAAYTSEARTRAIARSVALQEAMWMPALAATTLDPRSVPAGLYAEAVNHLYDMHEARVTADRNHVPEAALYLPSAARVRDSEPAADARPDRRVLLRRRWSAAVPPRPARREEGAW